MGAVGPHVLHCAGYLPPIQHSHEFWWELSPGTLLALLPLAVPLCLFFQFLCVSDLLLAGLRRVLFALRTNVGVEVL